MRSSPPVKGNPILHCETGEPLLNSADLAVPNVIRCTVGKGSCHQGHNVVRSVLADLARVVVCGGGGVPACGVEVGRSREG